MYNGYTTGVKIRLPYNTNVSAMVCFKLLVMNDYRAADYLCSGYLYAIINQWNDPRITRTGEGESQIKMGRDDDGRAYIWVSLTRYVGVHVHDVFPAHGLAEWDKNNWELVETMYTPSVALDVTFQ